MSDMNQASTVSESVPVTFLPELRDEEIHVTDEACRALAGLLEEAAAEDDVQAVRVFVSGGGCGGMSYGMTFTDSSSPYDKLMERDGLKLYVDAIALSYLRGAEIDYVDQPMGASFVFRNAFQSVGGAGLCSTCGSAGGGCA